MSADNMAVCPRCKEQKDHEKLLKRLETNYGKISSEEYLTLKEIAHLDKMFSTMIKKLEEGWRWCLHCGHRWKVK